MGDPKPLLARVLVRKAPVPEELRFSLDLRSASWNADGAIGPLGLVPAALDLIEIGRLVWEVERNTPKRLSSQRVREIEVIMPLRNPDAWSEENRQTLSTILRLLGNAEWHFRFTTRRGRTAIDAAASALKNSSQTVTADAVALFSGGLDSTSGLGWLRQEGMQPILASFYGAKAKQARIAKELGFEHHFQITCTWNEGRRRFGGQFQYRSFLFLVLGAAIANSCGAATLYQFENGPLAIGLPPSATYRMTRHAHPRLHALTSRLFSAVLGRTIEVRNPFLLKTKFEAANILRQQLSKKLFSTIIADTESCWNLKSRHIVGTIGKNVGEACGLCIPCVVRRTALRRADIPHAVDFTHKSGAHFYDPNARIHVDAYRLWARKMLDGGYALEQFKFEMPYAVRDAVAHSQAVLSDEALFDLYRRFAVEVLETFPAP